MTALNVQAILESGIGHHQAGRLAQAEAAYRQVLAQQPDHATALFMLGLMANQVRQNRSAIDLLGRAAALRPNEPDYQHQLGLAFHRQGQFDEAINAYQNTIKLVPDRAEAYNDLGLSLAGKGQLDAAITAYQTAISLKPGLAQAHNNLGITLYHQGRPDLAIASYQQALAIQPGLAETHANLAAALTDRGEIDPAIASYRQALCLDPASAVIHSKLIYLSHFMEGGDPARVYQEQRLWNAHHALPLKKSIQPHPNDRNPDRKLRIGYISPDFRAHCQSLFTIPLLSHHSDAVEVFCYADVLSPDALTDRLKSIVPHWNSIAGLSDQQVADQIRNDQIDILVDLTMHMAGNRLLVLARKPAPVQISYLAYPGSTGVQTIDYRISDPYLDPSGTDLSIYSEQTLLLPNSFWCYDPLEKAEDFPVNPLPALEKGYLTFGCLNNFCKVNDGVLELWAKALKQVQNSRLLLLAPAGSARQRVLEKLKQEGIDPSRIEFADFVPRQQYLKTYHRIDLALETLPYHGHTTSLDALWMGVPTPTLIGKTVVGRAGVSILSNVGLTDLIAETPEQYLQKISELANDLPKLNELRGSLREKMTASPLMNAQGFAKDMEQLYRQAWKKRCAGTGASAVP